MSAFKSRLLIQTWTGISSKSILSLGTFFYPSHESFLQRSRDRWKKSKVRIEAILLRNHGNTKDKVKSKKGICSNRSSGSTSLLKPVSAGSKRSIAALRSRLGTRGLARAKMPRTPRILIKRLAPDMLCELCVLCGQILFSIPLRPLRLCVIYPPELFFF